MWVDNETLALELEKAKGLRDKSLFFALAELQERRTYKREEEVSCVMTMIQKLCVSANITLFAKCHNGHNCVTIKDESNGKTYAIARIAP